jgi:hypothetical protein
MTSRNLAAFIVGAVATLALAGSVAHAAPIKVSCVGENTTCTGHYAANLQWPDVLGQMLGAGYTVDNDGDNTHATVLMSNSGATPPVPYTGSYANPTNGAAPCGGDYARSLMSPDVVVIGPWGMHDYATAAANNLTTDQARFQKDYEFLVSQYLKLANKPKVFLTTPILLSVVGGNVKAETATYITNIILPSVKAVAMAHGLPIIDLYTQFPASLLDPAGDGGITHPAGQTKIAQLVQAALTGGTSPGDGGVADSGSTAGTGGGAGSGGTAGSGGSTPGTAGSSGAGTGGTAGTGGGTPGTAGTGVMTGTAGAGGGTPGTAGTGGGTPGTAGTGGGTPGTAGTGVGMTGTAGTGGGPTGAAGSSTVHHSSGGGCALGGRSVSGSLATVFLALTLVLTARRRRRG